MIGAMPAVAVRHERRRQEKRSKRPSLLYLQSTQSRSTSPSPVQSSPGLYSTPQLEIYILGKVSDKLLSISRFKKLEKYHSTYLFFRYPFCTLPS